MFDLSELMKKVSSMVEGVGDMVLKYQLIPEDLDALVSVRTEEDVKHMIEEHDRHHTGALLRAFLFPPFQANRFGCVRTVSVGAALHRRHKWDHPSKPQEGLCLLFPKIKLPRCIPSLFQFKFIA